MFVFSFHKRAQDSPCPHTPPYHPLTYPFHTLAILVFLLLLLHHLLATKCNSKQQQQNNKNNNNNNCKTHMLHICATPKQGEKWKGGRMKLVRVEAAQTHTHPYIHTPTLTHTHTNVAWQRSKIRNSNAKMIPHIAKK